jgi:hypothetical protein
VGYWRSDENSGSKVGLILKLTIAAWKQSLAGGEPRFEGSLLTLYYLY